MSGQDPGDSVLGQRLLISGPAESPWRQIYDCRQKKAGILVAIFLPHPLHMTISLARSSCPWMVVAFGKLAIKKNKHIHHGLVGAHPESLRAEAPWHPPSLNLVITTQRDHPPLTSWNFLSRDLLLGLICWEAYDLVFRDDGVFSRWNVACFES